MVYLNPDKDFQGTGTSAELPYPVWTNPWYAKKCGGHVIKINYIIIVIKSLNKLI